MISVLFRECVRKILERPLAYDWTLQGFGLLRLYLRDVGRIHVWDDRYAVRGVSVIHDHFWPLESIILAGSLTNIRYALELGEVSATHWVQAIRTGEGGGPIGDKRACRLTVRSVETYTLDAAETAESEGASIHREGEFAGMYWQGAHEIHETRAVRGTVSVMARPEHQGEAKTARVFWPHGSHWVSAEPRPATPAEIGTITTYALAHFDSDAQALDHAYPGRVT